MAKVKHYYSEVAGHVPATLLRGQIGITIPDQTVYAPTPDGQVKPISSGKAGVANANTLLGVHIPVDFHPVVQFAPGYTQQQLQAKWNVTDSAASLDVVPVFGLGRLFYTPPLTCALSANGIYQLTITASTRSASLTPVSSPLNISGSFNPVTGNFSIIIVSENQIAPWFYVQSSQGFDTVGDVYLYRISDRKTFGAIPVSQGFAGAPAQSYWGTYP